MFVILQIIEVPLIPSKVNVLNITCK